MVRVEALNRLISEIEGEIGEELVPSSLSNRIKIQKLVYLAQEFGVDFDYGFNMYVHGPYSPSLAQEYYSGDFRQEESSIPGMFDREAFYGLVDGKSKEWLELATTIHKLYNNYQHRYSGEELRNEVIESAAAKKNAQIEEAATVYDELESSGLLN